ALAENMRGKVGTWVNSQWKYHATPGQFSVAINNIAINWGFNDISHFNRSFKAAFSLTPTQWRRASG
ncbi:helix-turn-helix domain-containing protein, partial [Agrobacterium sp. 22-221-1]